MQIAIAVITLALCGGFLFWFKRSEERKKKKYDEDEERELAQRQTAQEFVNAKDVSDGCLYTLDGMIFAAVQITGLCLELYNRAELRHISRTLTTRLSEVRYPYKFLAVPRPIDVSRALMDYEDMYINADGGRRKLLKSDMAELADKAVSGQTLERQYYIIIWGEAAKYDARDMSQRAAEMAKLISESGMQAAVLDERGYVRLCNLVNIPAYVQMESMDIDDTISVLRQD